MHDPTDARGAGRVRHPLGKQYAQPARRRQAGGPAFEAGLGRVGQPLNFRVADPSRFSRVGGFGFFSPRLYSADGVDADQSVLV